MIFAALFICILYSILILYFAKGFDLLKSPSNLGNAAQNQFSILIPFRNEADQLPGLLQSLGDIAYPANKMEIILINDQSDDGFEPVINDFKSKHEELNIRLIHSKPVSSAPKKEAIEQGIRIAAYPWIVTTDADCQIPANWLKAFDNFICLEKPKMIAAPVTFSSGNGMLHHFQLLDFLSLQGATMGSFGMKGKWMIRPFLCNGANLCYEKKAFAEVNGYEGNRNIASGDDIFLLEKMYDSFPGKVRFLKSSEAIVHTASANNWKELLKQRIRWASKTSSYNNNFGKLVGLLVFGTNTMLVILMVLAFLNHFSWKHLGLFFIIKFNIDFLLLYKTAVFFDQKEVLKSYFPSSILHPIFTITAALLSLKKSYSWKGRHFKK